MNFFSQKNQLVVLVAIAVLLVVRAIWISVQEAAARNDFFFSSPIAGKIVEIDDLQHGLFELQIESQNQQGTLSYTLGLGSFVEDKGIQVGDSVFKPANTVAIIFFKKKNNRWMRLPYQ